MNKPNYATKCNIAEIFVIASHKRCCKQLASLQK